jgi:hypothetical protein
MSVASHVWSPWIKQWNPTKSLFVDSQIPMSQINPYFLDGLPSGKLTQLWKITIFHGNIHPFTWWFSIVMLNYQRVNHVKPPFAHASLPKPLKVQPSWAPGLSPTGAPTSEARCRSAVSGECRGSGAPGEGRQGLLESWEIIENHHFREIYQLRPVR